MRICFVVGDVRSQQATYAGVHLAVAAHRRGHDVRFVSVDDLSFLDDNTVLGLTRRVRHGDYSRTADYARALSSDEAVVEEDNLGGFDVVLLRYNPTREAPSHRDAAAPLIDFAWRLRLAGTLVVNDPEGLRRAASRMYLAEFPEEIRVKTFVSRSPERLKEWVKGLRGPAVLKPLQPRGGAHVFFVDPREASNLNQIITTVTKGGYAIAQQYQPEIEAGEKRLLLLGAEPVRVGKRVAIYRRHSLIGGADGAPHEATGNRARCGFGAAEARICDLLRPKLLADGLYFVGVDIVGDKVLELNVFTPGGIHSIRELYGVDVADVVIRDLERRVRRRAAYRTTFDPEAADTV